MYVRTLICTCTCIVLNFTVMVLMLYNYYYFFVDIFSRAQRLVDEEALSKEAFFDRCTHNPHLRDRLPILTRNLDMQRKVHVHTCIYTLAAYMYMYTEFYRKIIINTLFMQKFVDDERFLYIDTALSVDPVVSEHLHVHVHTYYMYMCM